MRRLLFLAAMVVVGVVMGGANGAKAQYYNQCAAILLQAGCDCRPDAYGNPIITCDRPAPQPQPDACATVRLEPGCACTTDYTGGPAVITCHPPYTPQTVVPAPPPIDYNACATVLTPPGCWCVEDWRGQAEVKCRPHRRSRRGWRRWWDEPRRPYYY